MSALMCFSRVLLFSVQSRMFVFRVQLYPGTNDFLKLLLCRHFDQNDALHIRSHCRFSAAGLPLQVIGGRGATGRAAQEKDFPAVFRGQFLDTFLRGLW